MRKRIYGSLLAVMAAIWSPGSVGAQTARQIAAELFDFPIHEIGQASVLGAKFGCDDGLIDTWDELRMVLLLAAFDQDQLQAAFDQMNGNALSLAMCVKSVHTLACNPKAIDFVAPSVAGAAIGGVAGAVAERVIGGPIGALMNPAIGAASAPAARLCIWASATSARWARWRPCAPWTSAITRSMWAR